MKAINNLKFPAENLFTRNSLVMAITLAISVPVAVVKAESSSNTDSSAQTSAETAMQFDIPVQNLSSAMAAFTAQSHVQVLYEGSITQGLRSAPLKGSYTPVKALQVLLMATGLQSRFTGARTVTLERKAVSSGVAAGGNTLAAVTVTAAAAVSNAFAEPEDRINYALLSSSAATKTDTPIMELPASVQVVTRALMNDQQVISPLDALKNIAGVQNSNDTYGLYQTYMIRGFQVNNSGLRNGLIQDSVINLETANIARIDVLKGPVAGLYGRSDPGGMVSNQTYRPQDESNYSLQQQFGSYSLYRTVLDATGPILEDKSLLYRLNFAYKANNSFRDYVNADHVFLMPSITWRPNDAFEVNVNMEYQHDSFIYDTSLVAVGTAPIKMPISSFLADGTALQSYPSSQDRTLFAYDWNYHFNADWKLTNRFKFEQNNQQQTAFNGAFMSSPTTLVQGLWYTPLHRNSYTTNLDLTGNFDTGFIHHSTLLGYDLYQLDNSSGPGHIYPLPSLLPPVNIYSPYQYPINLALAPSNFSYNSSTGWNGLYFQDQMKLWDQLFFTFGGRWDWASTGSANGGGGSPMSINFPTINNNAFKPRFGLLYQPVEWGSVYTNYTESFGANNGISATGQSFAPQTGVQYEVGAKTEFFDKRLLATLALYSITKNNMLTPMPGNPLLSIAVGQARSKGVEFQVQGDVTKNISLIGGYSYIAAKITEANDGTQGNMLPNVPLNSGNMWTKYKFDQDVLPGVTLGTGVYLQGMRQGDIYNSFQLPGYARWDASAAYSFEQFGGKITTQLNVYNILNKIYYDSAIGGNTHVIPGIPLTLLGSVRVEF